MKEKIILGMSGGVDSSVAALLLKEQGYDVVGVTLRLLACGGESDAEDAGRVAQSLGLSHETVSFTDTFRREVMDRFAECYIRGATPNPCIDCNRYIKFVKMMEYARERGIDKIATGHYARICRDANGRYLLKKAVDAHKDQSYVLYSLTQDQLSRARFPLGEYHKEEIRTLAEKYQLVNANKRDSQDICFVPDGDYASFIEQHTGLTFPEGDFLDMNGNWLGTHRGMIRYTVGQRKGLGIALGKPAFVCRKDVETNAVIIGDNEQLFRKTLTARDVNWIACDTPSSPIRITAKIRYGQAEQPAVATVTEEGRMRVDFDTPQRAIANGQSVVLYDGDTVVGGGIIDG